jgi:N-glycosylase/DNA lyase
MKDDTITLAVQTFYGLRLIRQERWECLASFVLATNSNILRIKKMVQAVCARFGEPLQFEGIEYYAFPRPEVLSEAPLSDLGACGLGYRAPFLKHVAASVEKGTVDFSELSLLDYKEARKTLVKGLLGKKLLPGVGPKVADCVLLYSFDKDEAFPIDIWIAREIVRSYPTLLGPSLRMKLASEGRAKIGRSDYDKISSEVRSYFGPYAGYAQQYLFMMARSAGS